MQITWQVLFFYALLGNSHTIKNGLESLPVKTEISPRVFEEEHKQSFSNSSLHFLEHTPKTDRQLPLITPQEYMLRSLHLFVNKLRGYVDNNTFNTFNFKKDTSQLKTDFTKLIILAKPPLVRTSNLNQQLMFVQHLLQTMVDAVKRLEFFHKFNSKGAQLVIQMIRLKVCVSLLFDTKGTPEKSLSYFDAIVHNLYCEFQHLEKECQEDEYMSFMVWRMYKIESDLTRRLFDALFFPAKNETTEFFKCTES